jgi:simple sugar transport system ATP-binding protein
MKAIARKPSVLILDEPTSVLTPTEADEPFDVIRGWRAASPILHQPQIAEVLPVATRTVVMRRGRVVADGERCRRTAG